MKKIIVVFSVVAVLSMALVSVASADTVTGRGWLKAVGAGTATLWMSGDVTITGHGVGVIYIKNAAQIRAEGIGKRSDLPNGGVLLRGYRGKVFISGDNMGIQIVGGKIEFTAVGAGTAALKGRGQYWTHKGRGLWNVNGIDVSVGEPIAVE